MNSGIAFIASHLNIAGDLPTEILPGHILRRARETEIALIREYLGQLSPRAHVQWVNYESVVKEERYEGRTNLHFDHLPSEQWKYWVIAFEGSNQLIHEIETIGCLLPVDFDFAFQVYFSLPDQQGERMGWYIFR